MQLNNRYLRLGLLTLGGAILIYGVFWIIEAAFNITLPEFIKLTVAILGAGYLVYKFLSQRIF